MFTDSSLAREVPAHCKRCGGVLKEPVSFCIHCGIFHPIDVGLKPSGVPPTSPSAKSATSTAPTASTASTARSPIESAPDTPAYIKPSLLQASDPLVPDANVAPILPHPLALSIKHQPLGVKGAALFVVSILAFGVLWLGAEHRSSSLAHDVNGAQGGLSAARALLPAALTSASPESRREAALRAARSCAKDGKWDCVRIRANAALAVDPGSAQAQALLQRAIVASGWTPLARNRSGVTDGVGGGGGAKADVRAGSVAGGDGDPEVRAIVESGWQHPLKDGARVPGGGNVAGH